MHIWVSFSWTPRRLRVSVWGLTATSVEEEGPMSWHQNMEYKGTV